MSQKKKEDDSLASRNIRTQQAGKSKNIQTRVKEDNYQKQTKITPRERY